MHWFFFQQPELNTTEQTVVGWICKELLLTFFDYDQEEEKHDCDIENVTMKKKTGKIKCEKITWNEFYPYTSLHMYIYIRL